MTRSVLTSCLPDALNQRRIFTEVWHDQPDWQDDTLWVVGITLTWPTVIAWIGLDWVWPRVRFGYYWAYVSYIRFIFVAEQLREVWIILTLSTAVQDGRRALHSKQTRLLTPNGFHSHSKMNVSNNVWIWKNHEYCHWKQKSWINMYLFSLTDPRIHM